MGSYPIGSVNRMLSNTKMSNGVNFRVIFEVIVLLLLAFSSLLVASTVSAEEYTFFGAVSWDTDSALVIVVAPADNTAVQIYSLKDGKLLAQTQLNAMEKYSVVLAGDSLFKVVSNHIVSVMIFSDPKMATDTASPIPTGFYPSIDGYYVGKEFVFIASQGQSTSGQTVYRIIAFEQSDVNVQYENGSNFKSLTLKTNEFKDLYFEGLNAFKIISTGNIMVQCGSPGYRSFFVPSAEGGFMGKRFYSRGQGSWDPQEDYAFRITATEDAKLTIWNVGLKKALETLEVHGGESVITRPLADEVMIESDKPIAFSYVHNETKEREKTVEGGRELKPGVSYLGIKFNEESSFFLPLMSSVKAYVFTLSDAQVEVDDVPMTIKADEPLVMTTPGYHKIRSNKDLAIQMVQWSMMHGLFSEDGFAVPVPCIQTLNSEYNVNFSPLAEEGFPITYVAIGAAILTAIIVVIFVVKRRS